MAGVSTPAAATSIIRLATATATDQLDAAAHVSLLAAPSLGASAWAAANRLRPSENQTAVTNQNCSLSAPLRSGAVGGEDALRPGRAAFTGRPRSPRPSRSSCRSRRLLGEPGLRDGPSSRLAIAVGGDWKGKISPLFYISGSGSRSCIPRSRRASTSWSRSSGSCRIDGSSARWNAAENSEAGH